MTDDKNLGLIHIYTGNGKGKTTAAAGLSLRVAEQGLRVVIIQFMKALSRESGEISAIKRIQNVTVEKYGGNTLAPDHPPVEEIKREVAKGVQRAAELITSHGCDFLVLDEINVAVSLGFVDVADVLALVEKAKGTIELVMTGRNAPQELIDSADYVTEFRAVKHPFDKGIEARQGIEF